ncbi:MAG: N-acetyltransferase [Parvularculaceae bacterium]|nr:N-acetyltransferase [Parvularculaceae bacterium]
MTSALHIREASDDDRPAVLRVVEAAFGRKDEAEIVTRLWADDAAALEIIGEINGEIIGYCGFSVVTAEPELRGSVIGIAPVAVAPAHQNAGVGAAMIETGIAYCRTRGASLIVVLGEPAYYGRFGFKPASTKNMRWAALDAGDAFQLIDFAGLNETPARQIHYHSAFAPA